MSVFESMLFILCKTVEENTIISIPNDNSLGINKHFNFLKLIGINLAKINLWKPINAGIILRNFMMHTNGILEYAKNRKRIEEIIKNEDYLPSDVKSRRIKYKFDKLISVIESNIFGKKVMISNQYSYHFAANTRDFVVNVIDSIIGYKSIEYKKWPLSKEELEKYK